MARYTTLGEYRFSNTEDAASDIRGAHVYGTDGEKLGKIDDVIFDQATGGIIYAVVDTGGWLASRKFLVPPRQLQPSSKHQDDFQLNASRTQIENFPPYEEGTVNSDEKWADYNRRYRSQWVDSPVMHRVATDRNVTPTTKQQVDAGSGAIPSAEEETAEIPAAPSVTEGEMAVHPMGPEMRWTRFEDKLRERREEVLESSIRNLEKAERAGTASEQERRKAS